MAPTNAPGLSSLLDSGQFSDIVIKYGEGRELKAHKNILAAKSGWFQCAFNSGFQEASASSIQLNEDNSEALEIALRFLYDEELPLWPIKDLPLDHKRGFSDVALHLTLYELSNKYDIPSLANTVARDLAKIFKNWCWLCENLHFARQLYNCVSHDGHDLKKAFVKALTFDVRPLSHQIQEFAKENHEFAADLVSNMCSRYGPVGGELHARLQCHDCNYIASILIIPREDAKAPCRLEGAIHLIAGACPACKGDFEYLFS